MGLKEDIIKASKRVGIDPYKQPFKPSDLDLNSNDYGSFSDHCSKDDTASGKWASDVILKAVEKDCGGRPRKYLLIKG
jgi:hypothetical protein